MIRLDICYMISVINKKKVNSFQFRGMTKITASKVKMTKKISFEGQND